MPLYTTSGNFKAVIAATFENLHFANYKEGNKQKKRWAALSIFKPREKCHKNGLAWSDVFEEGMSIRMISTRIIFVQ